MAYSRSGSRVSAVPMVLVGFVSLNRDRTTITARKKIIAFITFLRSGVDQFLTCEATFLMADLIALRYVAIFISSTLLALTLTKYVIIGDYELQRQNVTQPRANYITN